MKKQIAVLMCALTLDNQKRLFSGMTQAARERDCNIYAFSNYVGVTEREESARGAYHIMTLPDFREFDGAIIAKGSIQFPDIAERAVRALQESRIPSVSVDEEIPGMGWVGMSSYEAQADIVEHFLMAHGSREIYYVSGPLFHKEGERRYRAYCDTLRRHGIPLSEDHVYEGYFDARSGRRAVEQFLSGGGRPEVIVCANDDMAFGVMEALKERGYRIPEDVRVAGFDDAEISPMCTPSLTTANRNQEKVGYATVCEVLSLIDGNPPGKRRIPADVELRESCGCRGGESVPPEEIKGMYLNERVTTQRIADTIRNMISDFSGMESPAELIESIKGHIIRGGLESFYLCLCEEDALFATQEDNMTGTLDIRQANTDYTESMHIPLACEKGEFTSYPAFPKGKVLPDECRNRSGGNFFIVSPLNYKRICYGYCIVQNSRFPIDNVLYYSWLTSIGIGLENIRKWMMLRDTVVKLNGVWAFDMLTGLYNRAGFYHHAKPVLRRLREEGKRAFLLFLDIDGLKQANDTLGHEIGDWMIREMAEVVRENLAEGQLAMRYGGDEFVILGGVEDEESVRALPGRIRRSMEKKSMQSDNLFVLRASIGISQYEASQIQNLDLLIEEADRKMYEEKRRKRATPSRVPCGPHPP